MQLVTPLRVLCVLLFCGVDVRCAVGFVPCEKIESARAALVHFQSVQRNGAEPYLPHPTNASAQTEFFQDHVPFITFPRRGWANITIGAGTVNDTGPVHENNVLDPAKIHFVPNIFVTDQDDRIIAMSEYAPTVVGPYLEFEIPPGTTRLRAWEYCNRHGLYAGYWTSLPDPSWVVDGFVPRCNFHDCFPDVASWEGGRCSEHERLFAEAQRRQYKMFTTFDAFRVDETSNRTLLQDVPYVTLQGSFGKVTVGKGTVTRNPEDPVHTTVSSSNPDEVHYIHSIFVKDQFGRVIAATMLTSDYLEPFLEFEVPAGTTHVTPFSLCTRAGLFEGVSISVDNEATGAANPFPCGVAECGNVPMRSRVCRNFESLRADLVRDDWYFQSVKARYHDTVARVQQKLGIHYDGANAVFEVTISGHRVESHPYDVVRVYNMYVVDQNDVVVAMKTISPTDQGIAIGSTAARYSLHFSVASGALRLRPIVVTTRLGITKGNYVDVVNTTMERGNCTFESWYTDTTGYDPQNDQCQLLNEFKVMMNTIHNTSIPNTDEWDFSDAMSFNGNKVTVTLPPVNHKNIKVTSDPNKLQYVKAIYVEDQHKQIVAAAVFAPSHEAVLVFSMDAEWLSYTPFFVINTIGTIKGVKHTDLPFSEVCAVSGCPEVPVLLTSPACPFDYIVKGLRSLQEQMRKPEHAPHPRDNTLDSYTTQEYTPYITLNGKYANVTLGSGSVNETGPRQENIVDGTSTTFHYAASIFVVNQVGLTIALAEFAPFPGSPHLLFEVPLGTESMQPFVFSNIHGLYGGYWTQVFSTGSQAPLCKMNPCFNHDDPHEVVGGKCAVYDALFKSALRKQGLFFEIAGSDVRAWPPDTQHSHEPWISYDKSEGTARVNIGVGGEVLDTTHMNETNDTIDSIFVEDNRGHIVGVKKFWGTLTRWEYEMHVPPKSLSLTPYAFSVRHGMFKGRTVQVQPAFCRIQAAGHDTPSTDVKVSHPTNTTPQTPPALCTPSTLLHQDAETYACSIQTSMEGLSIHWRWGFQSRVHIAIEARGSSGWLGMAFAEEAGRMFPADALVCSEVSNLMGFHLSGYNDVETNSEFEKELFDVACDWTGGATIMRFSHEAMSRESKLDLNVALDRSDKRLAMHSEWAAFVVDFDRGHAVAVNAEQYPRLRLLHGWLMMIAWCWLVPLSIMSKRYGKHVFGLSSSIAVGDMGSAVQMHVIFAGVGVIFTAFASVIALRYFTNSHADDKLSHTKLGVFIMLCSSLIVLLGVLGPAIIPREGRIRTVWGLIHKSLGRVLMVIALVQCYTGVKKLEALQSNGSGLIFFVGQMGVTALVAVSLTLEVIRTWFILSEVKVADAVKGKMEVLQWEEVKKHNDDLDPWLVVDGKVFAVKTWLRTHPGGQDVLLKHAGCDATREFHSFRHSRRARRKMESFLVGTMADDNMVSAITLAETITKSLSMMDLTEATAIIEKAHNTVPHSLLSAHVSLLKNLKKFTPFLPDSLKEGAVQTEAYLSREQLQDKNRRQNDPVVRNIELYPPTECAVALTDIQESCKLWALANSAMTTCVKVHNELIRSTIAMCRGYEVRNIGDAFMVVFESKRDCVTFAANVQVTLLSARWPQRILDSEMCEEKRDMNDTIIWHGPRVRVGIHWGDVLTEKNHITNRIEFFGEAISVVTAVHSLAMGGAIVSTLSLVEALSQRDRASMMELKSFRLGPLPMDNFPRSSYRPNQMPVVVVLVPKMLKGRAEEWFPTGASIDAAHAYAPYANPLVRSDTPTPATLVLPPHKYPQFSYRTSHSTVALVKPKLGFLMDQRSAPDTVQSFIGPLFDATHKSEGIIRSACGESFFLVWNVSKRCSQHAIQAARCLTLFYQEGWNTLRMHTSWDTSIPWGIVTGRVIHGKAGTDTQRTYVLLGGVVVVAHQLSIMAGHLNTHAVCMSMPRSTGIKDEPSLRAHIRPLEVCVLPEESSSMRALMWEVNAASLSKSMSPWGFARVTTFSLTPELLSEAVEALSSTGHDIEKLKQKLRPLLTVHPCASCGTGCASITCDNCAKDICLACTTGCTDHTTHPTDNWGAEGSAHFTAALSRAETGVPPQLIPLSFMLTEEPMQSWIDPVEPGGLLSPQ